MGFLCLIGIAHLPESMVHVKYSKGFEFRPMFTTDIGESIEQEMLPVVPKNAIMVTKNLFCAIRTVAGHILHRIPISGNVHYEDEAPLITVRNEDSEYDEEEDDGVYMVEKELKRRQLDEEDKFSAGAGGLGSNRKFKNLHQSMIGLKGSIAGGIQETVILDELIDRGEEDEDEEAPNTRVYGMHNDTEMLHNPMHESMVELERQFENGFKIENEL